jgi:LysM repeat protein
MRRGKHDFSAHGRWLLALLLAASGWPLLEASASAAVGEQERTWVKHKVVPKERLEDIAERYGVTRAEIIRWNKPLQKKAWIYAGQTLKVFARRVPPPREKITYEVQFGDTWQKIADTHGVRVADLRAWNPKVPRAFRAGAKLTVYTNPTHAPPEEEGEAAAPLPVFKVKPGGWSVGKPNRGRLVNGVQLPESDLYTVRDPAKAWGSSHTVLKLQEVIATWRRDTGFEGPLVIGAISKQGGGRFRPHRSHQSGRDIDIRLPMKSGASSKSSDPGDIDWRATWKLIETFIATGEVQYIFLDWRRQKLLYNAAKAAGASQELLDKAIQYPRPRKTNNGIVRHADGHIVHIHVRIKCAPASSRCES